MTCLPDLLWDSNEHSPSASEPAFLDLVYDELHRMASSLLRHERPAHTLQTSALVNEAFLKLSAAQFLRAEDRQRSLRVQPRRFSRLVHSIPADRHEDAPPARFAEEMLVAVDDLIDAGAGTGRSLGRAV